MLNPPATGTDELEDAISDDLLLFTAAAAAVLLGASDNMLNPPATGTFCSADCVGGEFVCCLCLERGFAYISSLLSKVCRMPSTFLSTYYIKWL
jgi:hypothetical protein